MGDMYSAVAYGSALDSVGDLITFEPASTAVVCIHRISIGQIDLEADAEAAMAHVKVSRFTSDATGGTTPTPSPLMPGGVAADTVIRVFPTVDATTSESILIQDAWNVQAGWLYLPTPEERIWTGSSETVVVRNMEIQTAANTAITVVFEEIKIA
jgi:hypothetical protein